MRGQAGFFDFDERLKQLSAKGDHLERLNGLIDFELFRPDLEKAVPRAAIGGRAMPGWRRERCRRRCPQRKG